LIYAETIAPDAWCFEAADGRTETVHVKGPLNSTNAGFVHQLALAGHGVILGPSFSFEADIAAGRLVPLLPGWRSPRELSIHALYPHRSLVSAKVRSFVDFLVERLGSEAEWQRARQPADMPAR
jgi:DNA-binding transcriptional LysR family regulator